MCEKNENQDFSLLPQKNLFTVHAPESDWAVFEVNENNFLFKLHKNNVYKMISETGNKFNSMIGFHLNNEHDFKLYKK